MSEEVRDPQKTFPRAIFGSGVLIALMYIAGTVAVLDDVRARRWTRRAACFRR